MVLTRDAEVEGQPAVDQPTVPLGLLLRFARRLLPSHRRPSAMILMFVVGLGLPARGSDQPTIPQIRCAPQQQQASLTLTLMGELSSPPGSPGPHWVITPLPSGDDIRVENGDVEFKNAIQQWVEDQSDPRKKHDWVLDGKNPWTLVNSGLRPTLQSTFVINPFPLILPPSAHVTEVPVGPIKGVVTLCYARAHTPYNFQAFDIVISSRGYNQELPSGPQLAKEVTDRVPLSINLPPGMHAFALLSKNDFSSPSEQNEILKAFGGVALDTWARTQQGGLKLGTAAKESDLQLMEQTISDAYSMAHNNIPARFWKMWPAPKVKFEIVNGKCCTLQVREIQTIRAASIRVNANLTSLTPHAAAQANQSSAESSVAPPAAADSTSDCVGGRESGQTPQEINADAVALQTEKTLTDRFAARLYALKDTVPTYAQIDSLRSDLATAREIHPTISLGVSCKGTQDIIFEGDNRFIVIPLKVTIGVGYSPEQQWFGKSDFQASNLVLQLREGSLPQENDSFTYAGGNQMQKLNALWALDWVPDSSRSTYGFHLAGDYLQDLNQRFGNLTGPILRDRERGIEPSFVYTFASSEIDAQLQPAKNLYGVQATTGFRYRRVNVEPSFGNILPPLATGSLVAYFLDLTPSYRFDSQIAADHGGIGGVDLNAAMHLIRGLPAGDFAFTQVLGSMRGTLYFGVATPRDFLLRFRKGLGTNTGAPPLFELFRLGGSDTLRGMEQGEFVGQKIAFEQGDAGVSVRQIVAWFKHDAKKLEPEQSPKPSPIDLSKIYVLGFYDRARITTASTFSDLLWFNHAPKGYGAEVEIESLSAGTKRLSLSLGYGYSPDSVLHRKGVVVTSAQLDF
jgi:hypothetical protein